MSSITAADLRFGGRLTAACDAIAESHLNRAAGIFAEVADELNQEATANGLLADEPAPVPAEPVKPVPASPVATPQQVTPMDLQSCARNAHSYGAPDSNGWRHCLVCGVVNVAPPDGNGHIDMSARNA